MNKIYKIVWNPVRGQHVVTDEAHRSQGKGKRLSALLLASLLTVLSPGLEAAVTVSKGWGHTLVSTTGNVSNITTDKIVDGGKIAVNRFADFTVDKNHIANLKLPKSVDNLLNFVEKGVEVNGTVNSLKGEAVGGNLFFVTPQGMTIGATGVINAGSLTSVVTTQDAFDNWISESGGTLPNISENLLQKMQSAEVPVNPAGIITVEGSINAGNRVVLAASKIDVRAGARISNVREAVDFEKLVNITGENGSIVTSAGVAGGLVAREADDGSGDIVLLARSDGSTQTVNPSVTAEVNVAGVLEGRENVTVKALAGAGTYDLDGSLDPSRGEGNFKENGSHNIADVTAKVTVTGTIRAAEDINITAEAQNHFGASGLIELAKSGAFEVLGSITPFNFDFGFGDLTTHAEVAVQKEAEIAAQGSLTTTATADTYLKVGTSTATVKLFDILSNLNGKIPAAGVVVGLADSSADVTIEGTLAVGKNLEIKAVDKLEVELASAASTSLDKSSHVALVVGHATGSSNVDVKNTADITLSDASSQAGSAQQDARTVSIRSEHTSDIRTSARATTEQEAYGALAFNYTEHNSSATLALDASLKGVEADEVDIGAQNTTLTERMSAVTTSGLREGKKLQLFQSLAAASSNFVSEFMGRAGNGIDKSFSTANFKLGGAVGVVTGTQDASVSIGSGVNLSAGKSLAISASSVKSDHHYSVSSSSNGKATGGQHDNAAGSASLALLVAVPGDDKDTSVASSLTIGDSAVLKTSGGGLVLDNRAEILYERVDSMVSELLRKIEYLKAYSQEGNVFEVQWDKVDAAADELRRVWNDQEGFAAVVTAMSNVGTVLSEVFGTLGELGGLAGDVVGFVTSSLNFIAASNYVNTYVAASGVGAGNAWDAALAVGISMQKTQSELAIGKGVELAAFGPEDLGSVSINGSSRNETVMLGGNLSSLYGVLLPVITDANAVGASILWHSVASDNTVRMREGVVIRADGLAGVTAADESTIVTLGASADVSKGSASIEANAVIADLQLANTLQLDDEISISGAGVALNAAREDSVQTISGALNVGSGENASTNVGAGIAVNTGEVGNELTIADNDVLEAGDKSLYALAGGLTATGSVEAPSSETPSGDATNAENPESSAAEDKTEKKDEFKPLSGTVSITADADLDMNAVGAAGGVSSTSQGGDDPDEPYDPSQHNAVFNKLHDWYTQAKGGLSWAGDWCDNQFNKVLGGIESLGGTLGKDLRQAVPEAFKQNSTQNDAIANNGASGADPENNPGNVGEQGPADLSNPQAQNPLDAQQAQRFQLGLAASVAVNDVDAANALSVTASHFTIDTADLLTEAVSDKWIGAWAGAAGLSFVEGTSVDQTAAAGGAIAVNTGASSVTVTLNGLDAAGNQGLVLTDRVEQAQVYAVSDGTIIAEGLAAAVAKGSGQESGSQYSFDASVSANILENTVSNDVSGLAQTAGTKDFEWDQAAWSGETQVTGGTGFGLTTQATGSGRSASFGALVAVADIANTITSSLKSAEFEKAQTVDVRALASVTQVTTAVGANVALGDSSLALTGAAASATLANTVSTVVDDVVAELSEAGLMQVVARDASGDEKSYFDSISEQDWYPQASQELDNSDFYKDVYLQTEQNQDKKNAQHVSDFLSGKEMVQTTVAVSVGVSTEDNAAGAGIVVNNIDNTFKTTASNVTLTTAAGSAPGTDGSHYMQRAESGVASIAVATGVAGGAGGEQAHFAAAGSVIVSNVDQSSESTARSLNITTDNTTIEAGNAATTVNVAGNVGVSMGQGGSAAGAAVVVMNTDNDAAVEVDASSIRSGALTLRGLNKASAWSVAADATVSGKFALGGSVSVNRVMNAAQTTVSSLTLVDLSKADIAARDESELWSLAGAVAYGDQSAGLSGAVAYSISGRESSPGTQVSVSDLSIQGDAGTDVTIEAAAGDKVGTLVIAAGVSRGAVGFTGAAGVNEIKRTVSAELKNVTASSGALKALSVKAQEQADIGNLGIAGAYGSNAGIGLGIAVNRISTNTTASLSDERTQKQEFSAQTIEVKAKSANDIETIAVGGAASQNAAATGSVGVNLIADNTAANVRDVRASVSGALLVDAQTDDVIGAYVGQAAGASTAAAGLSVLVNESNGTTQANVTASTLTETGGAQSTLSAAGAVDDSAVNDQVANDVSLSGTLEDDRDSKTVSGILVTSTGTTTFKSLVLNGAGAGTGAATGTVGVTYLGGKTQTVVVDSVLNAKDDVEVFAAHYVNVDNISTTGAGAGTGAGALAVNVVTTERAIATSLDGGSVESDDDVTVKAQAKEGVSSLAIVGAGAGTGAGVVLANVTRELSDVSVDVARTKATVVDAGTLHVGSDYLGRYNAMGLTAAGSGAVAGAASVNVNYADNDSSAYAGHLTATVSEKAEVLAHRRTENSGVTVNLTGSQYGALAATVLVNTVEGTAKAQTEGSKILSQSGTQADIAVQSKGDDAVDLVDVSAAGAIVGGGAAVMVNRFYGAASTIVNSSSLTGGLITVSAEQNRFVDATNVFASAGLGTLGANVVSTLIGADGDPFASQETALGDTQTQIDDYLAVYADSGSADNPGIFGSALEQTTGVLTETERGQMMQAAAKKAAAEDAGGGTSVSVAGSTIEAGTVSVQALEDTAQNAGVDVTVGSGQAGGAVLAASVATLRQNRNLAVDIAGSSVSAREGGVIGAQIGGKTSVETYQAAVALAAGIAAYTDVEATGGAAVRVKDSRLESTDQEKTLTISAVDRSDIDAFTFGLNVSVVGGGSTIAGLRDETSLLVDVSGGSLSGATAVEALRDIKRTVQARSGVGGALNGQASSGSIRDSGDVTVTIADLDVSGDSFAVDVNNKPELLAKAYQGYASAISVGILDAAARASGTTSVSVTNSRLEARNVEIDAAFGRLGSDADPDADAMKISASVQSYGAAVIGGATVNKAVTSNASKTQLNIADNLYDDATDLHLEAQGYAVYDAMSDLGAGGVVAGGNSCAEVAHEAQVAAAVSATDARLNSFELGVANRESAALKAYSAGGTVIEASEKAAQVNHVDASNTTADVSGFWNTVGDAAIASTSGHTLRFEAENTKGVVAGGSSVLLQNSMSGNNVLSVSGTLSAGGGLTAGARTDIDINSVDKDGYVVDAAVYGAFSGAEGRAESTISRASKVNVAADARLSAGKELAISAYTDETNTLRVRGRTAGAAGGVTAYNNNTETIVNSVDVASGAKIENGSEDEKLSITASSSEMRRYEAVGDLQGAAVGGAGAKSTNAIAHANSVSIAAASSVSGAGDVLVGAGRDAMGAHAKFDYTGYTHAYAHALGGADSALQSTFDVSDSLTVAGSVTAVRDLDAAADVGDWSVKETTRYWVLTAASDAGSVKLASSGAGSSNPDNFNPVGTITVDGSLTAGTQTYSKVTISGVVNTDEELEIEGSSAQPLIHIEGVEGRIEVGSEDVANLYWDRYRELQELIASYGDRGDSESRAALVAYKAEAQMLQNKMIDSGYAITNASGQMSLIASDTRGFASVSDIVVSGGDISLSTGSVKGKGTISANAAEGIVIENSSNLALKVEDVRILDKGGVLKFNSASVGSLAGFEGTVSSQANAADPTISIASDFGGTLTVKDKANGKTQSVRPDNSIVMRGIVANDVGSLEAKAAGDISIIAQRVAAATDLKLEASGSVVQSHTSGLLNVGGSVEDLYKDEAGKTDVDGKYASDVVRTGSSVMVAGGDVYLNADNVNLNGLVQSGYGKWSVELGGEEAQSRIEAIRSQWIAAGAPSTIDPTSSAYLISEEGTYQSVDGTYAKRVAAWYDPVNDRIIVDDIAPQGGHIYITGRVASTGGGKLYAAAGSMDIEIDAGKTSVLLGEIDTGNTHGIIQITDTSYAGENHEGKTVDALVTRWSNSGSDTTVVGSWQYSDGSSAVAGNASTDGYAPRAGQVYMWSTGTHNGTVSTIDRTQDFTVWGLFDWGDPSSWTADQVTKVQDENLGSGATIGVRPSGTSSDAFVGWTDTTAETTGNWDYETWTTYANWTHFSGTHHLHGEKHDTSTEIRTYTVKADHSVGVGFMTGKNTIDVRSDATIELSGNVTATGGSVTLVAGADILSASNSGAIRGAQSVSLEAGGSIGSESSAVRLTGSSGIVNFSAEAARDIYLDASSLAQGACVSAEKLIASGTIDMTVRGTMTVQTVRAQDMRFESQEGSLAFNKLTQLASEDGSQRLDAFAADDVVIHADGDLGIGTVRASDSVSIVVSDGSLSDAIAREDLDERNAQERIQGWINAGILGEGGTNNGEVRWQADVQAQTDIVTAEYNRYDAYRNLTDAQREMLASEQQADYGMLKERFGDAASLEAAINAEKANSESALAKTIAAGNEYGWTKEELLFAVSNAIVNPDAGTAPQAGEANIESARVNIVVNDAGNIGNEVDQTTYSFADLDITTEKGLEAFKLLSRADVSDVVWDAEGGSVTVTLKRPISIKLEGEDARIDAQAPGNVFVASDAMLSAGRVIAGELLRMTSQNGIEAAGTDSLMEGASVTLRGGDGGLGTEKQALAVNATSADGWLALTANQGVYVTEIDGVMRVLSAASNSEMVLAADGVEMAEAAGQLAQGVISAESLTIAVADGGSIGTSDEALRLSGACSLTLGNANNVGGLYLDVAGAQEFRLAQTINAQGVSVRTQGDLDVEGDIAAGADGVVLQSQGSLTVAAQSVTSQGDLALSGEDIWVDGSKLAAKSLSISAPTGGVNLSGNETIEAETLCVQAAGDVDLSNREITLSQAASVEAGGGVAASNSTIKAQSLRMLAAAGVDAQNAQLTATNELTLAAGTDLQAQSATLSAESVELKAATGSVAAESASVTTSNQLNVSAAGDVDLAESTLAASGSAVSVSSDGGNVDLSGEALLEAESVRLSASGDVNLANRQITASQNAVIEADGSVSMQHAELDVGSLRAASHSGAIDAAKARLSVKVDLSLTASGDVELVDAVMETEKDSPVAITTQSGSVNMTGVATLAGGSIAIQAARDVVFNEGQTVTASEGDLLVNAAGSLFGKGIVADASGSLTLSAGASNNLSGATLSNTGALVLRAGTVRVDSTANELDLTGVVNNGLAVGGFSGTSVTLETSGSLVNAGEAVVVSARDGDAKVLGNRIDFAENSSVTATGGDVAVDAVTSFAAGKNLALVGDNVSVTGGLESFQVGNDATFVAKAGRVDVVGDADLALGGKLTVDAQKGGSSDPDAGDVVIGTRGVLSVADDMLEIVARNGSVTVYGGNGMSIRNDLTVVSNTDTVFLTEQGDLSIGNQAVVKAGSQSGLEQNQYGVILVHAGDEFTIGDSATLLADELKVEATGDIVFGDKATLWGATEGVTVASTDGSIRMGSDLTVVSNADKTLFSAQKGDIVVGRQATLTSSNSAIEFAAGRDVVFDADFTVRGEGFVVSAGNNVTVGDDQKVETIFAATQYDTLVSAGNSIVFGDRAQFRTTELVLDALGGNVEFGDDSLTLTSISGIQVKAAGSVTYGDRAVFGTFENALVGDISITAASGSVELGENSVILSGGMTNITAANDVKLGNTSTILSTPEQSNTVVRIVAATGDIELDEGALLEGCEVLLKAGNSDLTEGGGVHLGDEAWIVTSNAFRAEAAQSIRIDGNFNVYDVTLGGNAASLVHFETGAGDVMFADNALLSSQGPIEIVSGRDIRFGKNALIGIEESESIDPSQAPISSALLDARGVVDFDENAFLRTKGFIAVLGDQGVSFAENAQLGSSEGSVTIESALGSVALKGRASAYAKQTLEISAGDDVLLTGESWLDAEGELKVTARKGDILMTEGVRLGGVDDVTNVATEQMTLIAAGSVTQQDIACGMGLTAENLVVSAGADVLLGAVDNGDEQTGNSISAVSIETGGSIELGLSYASTDLKINEAQDGFVNGSVTIHAAGTSMTIGNDLTVAEDAQFYGRSIATEDIAAGDKLVMSTAAYDASGSDGIRTGTLAANSVGLMTEEGAVRLEGIEASAATVVYRTSSEKEGAVHIGGGHCGSAMIFNANGGISGQFTAAGNLYVFTGFNADTSALKFNSDSGRMAVIGKAQSIANFVNDDYVIGLHAGDIMIDAFPILDFSNFAQGVAREPSLTLMRTQEAFRENAKQQQKEAQSVEELVTDRWSTEIETKGWYTAKQPVSLTVSLRD